MYVMEALGEHPSRETLRSARRALAPLAKAGALGAAEELAALDSLMRMLYPRGQKATRPVKSGRKAKAKAPTLIEPSDCMGPCPRCGGTGDLRIWFVRSTWNNWHPKLREMLHKAPTPCMQAWERHFETCPDCDGSGRKPVGVGEHPFPIDLYPAVPLSKQWHLRGDFAQQDGLSETDPGIQPNPHDRGYAGGSIIHKRQLKHWDTARGFKLDVDNADLTAREEAGAIAANAGANRQELRSLIDLSDPDARKLTSGIGKKLLDRRDRRNLKPGQHRRSRMDDRTKRRQAEWDRQNGLAPTRGRRKSPEQAMLDAAERAGLDVEALRAAIAEMDTTAQPVRYDEPLVAEARRRADLNPDDAPDRDPSAGVRNRVLMEYARRSDKAAGVRRGDLILCQTVLVDEATGLAVNPDDQDIIDRHEARFAAGEVYVHPIS